MKLFIAPQRANLQLRQRLIITLPEALHSRTEGQLLPLSEAWHNSAERAKMLSFASTG